MSVEEEWKSRFWLGGLITSHEGNHYGYMMNTTSCCWNIMERGYLRIRQEDVKMKTSELPSNLT
jgi:hypothetical protein